MAKGNPEYLSVYVSETVQVPVDEIIRKISDEQIMAEAVKRFGGFSPIERDVLAEIEGALLRRRIPEALAIVENQRTLTRVPDVKRSAQLSEMRVAGIA